VYKVKTNSSKYGTDNKINYISSLLIKNKHKLPILVVIFLIHLLSVYSPLTYETLRFCLELYYKIFKICSNICTALFGHTRYSNTNRLFTICKAMDLDLGQQGKKWHIHIRNIFKEKSFVPFIA